MNLFFSYIFTTLTYRRADVRGLRAVGDKRRLAWPEMLIIIFPLYWAISIIMSAVTYVRALECNGGHPFLNVQVAGFQWGWRYCYDDVFYSKYFYRPLKAGRGSSFTPNTKDVIVDKEQDLYESLSLKSANGDLLADSSEGDLTNTHSESYFCKLWIKESKVMERDVDNPIKNRLHQTGYWVSGQGIDADIDYIKIFNGTIVSTEDNMRLLRSTGYLVLPSRIAFRIMSCGEDVTHSWAMPALGLKMDCVPGRLFAMITIIPRDGIYFGQCSELCGLNHFNMPAILYALPVEHFIIWWELDLHTIFLNYKNSDIFRLSPIDSKDYNYSLLDLKYK